MHVILFGTGCDSCIQMAQEIEKAIQTMNLSVRFEKSNDFQRMLSYGIKSTPALVIDEKVVAVGKKLSADDIRSLFYHE